MPRTLSDWLTHIDGVHPRAWDLGLERVREVAQRMRVLPPARDNVVVAGTNGKGSTSVYTEALLLGAGKSVGTTLSPHLERFNERIRVDGMLADDGEIVCAFAAIDAARGATTLTYFEYGILAALDVFRRRAVDATVLEVGLGGRLDAVNIVDGRVTAITSIGLDHQDYLGPDIESIAGEKAGVLRPGVPCVFGEPTVPRAIEARAASLGAPLLVAERDFGSTRTARDIANGTWSFWGRRGERDVRLDALPMPSVALRNAATALQAVLLLPDVAGEPQAWVGGARSACLPGRFERGCFRGRECVLDVAHNPHGAAFLAEQLAAHPRAGRTVAVFGCLKDKDAAGIVAALDAIVDEWVFVGSGTARGQAAAATLDKVGFSIRAHLASDVAGGLVAAAAIAEPRDRIVVLGSFDVVRQARECVGAGA